MYCIKKNCRCKVCFNSIVFKKWWYLQRAKMMALRFSFNYRMFSSHIRKMIIAVMATPVQIGPSKIRD